jgi:DNA-binding NarL/FixJ family response regulator
LPVRPVDLRGVRILVVEDEFLVSLDLEAMLRELGGEVIGPFAGLERATAVAQAEALDVALLDVNVGPAGHAGSRRARRTDHPVRVLHGLCRGKPARAACRGSDRDEALPAATAEGGAAGRAPRRRPGAPAFRQEDEGTRRA